MARNEMAEHILSLSYGKDSLACLGALEHAGGGAELQMVLTDEKRALLGDHEAAKRLTDAGVLVMQGDCLELLKDIPDGSVDMVLTDPPYGKKSDKGTNGFGVAKTRRYTSEWDKKTPPKEVFDKICTVSKNAIVFGGNYFANMLPISNCWIFWDKKGDIAFQNPFADGELIYTTFKKPVKRIVFRQQGFITDSKDKRYHPTQKPTELLEFLIREYTNPGDTVLDPFMGSGSTGVACVNTGRKFIGMELDPGYFEVAKRRIEEAQAQARLDWNTRAPILSESELKKLEETI